MNNNEQIADYLVDQHTKGQRFVPFASERGVTDLDAAYSVQKAFVARMKGASAAPSAGYKVGLTSKRMQAMCGIDTPVAGVVLEERIHTSGKHLQLSQFGRLGLEFEICVIAGKDLPAIGRDYTAEEIASAVGAVAAAVEIVDDRHCDYATLDVLSLVADNSWNAGVVVGEQVPSPANLADCEAVVSAGGVEFDRGRGADALGGPLVPFTWLANHLCRQGGGLRRGDLVMTGSLVTTQFPQTPQTYRFVVSGIGTVEVVVTA
jgi:2-keto-4-pentenoate hydratase